MPFNRLYPPVGYIDGDNGWGGTSQRSYQWGNGHSAHSGWPIIYTPSSQNRPVMRSESQWYGSSLPRRGVSGDPVVNPGIWGSYSSYWGPRRR
jgi:hypothetical protein